MRNYRGYNSILWGERFDTKSQAHHCQALDCSQALSIFRNVRLPSLQVQVGDKWQWVTETPHYLGGICGQPKEN